jgi:hypothetical protein
MFNQTCFVILYYNNNLSFNQYNKLLFFVCFVCICVCMCVYVCVLLCGKYYSFGRFLAAVCKSSSTVFCWNYLSVIGFFCLACNQTSKYFNQSNSYYPFHPLSIKSEYHAKFKYESILYSYEICEII